MPPSSAGTWPVVKLESAFDAKNTYAGTTTISAGTLQIGAGATGSIAGDIVDNSALVFNRTGTLVYGGAISGSGTVSKAGTGTVTLTGDSTYLGGTTISAGTLQLGNGGTSGSITGTVRGLWRTRKNVAAW